MEVDLNAEGLSASPPNPSVTSTTDHVATPKPKSKTKDKEASSNKRRCVSTACIACRRRKSKCDGNLPKCAACASVYLTDCEYAPHTDHRRKGVYKKDSDGLKTRNSALQILMQALLNAEEEDDAFGLVREIRACESLEELAQAVENRERGIMDTPDSPIYGVESTDIPQFEAELSGKMGDLVIDGSIRFIGGTSNLIWLNDTSNTSSVQSPLPDGHIAVQPKAEAILSWTSVTHDKSLILHFINMYFCWHYAYFTTLSKELFYRDFLTGTNSQYCSPLLVNVMLALGCHFSSKSAARSNPDDSSTTGDHYFAEAKRLLHADDEFSLPKLCTVQALALMSVREAGCGRESKGWVYSGMSFRLASDLGLNVDAGSVSDARRFSDEEVDARRVAFWGCFLFDKCWSNYLGRQPQFLLSNTNVKKPDVFGSEDSELWSPYTDSGIIHTHTQPARTRAVSLQIFKLAEISSDLLSSFYQPQQTEKHLTKQSELKRLSDIHTRLEAWRRDLPVEMEAKDGQLPQVLLMHMFYQLLYIHLYRPFLKYTKATSPLPAHVSPRKFCTQAAGAISKLFRLYKRTHGLRQICNIAVYIAHSACTIHLLNLPDKNAKRDIIHGMKQLEEIGDCWICARRTIRILGLCAEKWKIEFPEEAQACLERLEQRWGAPEATPASFSPQTLSTVMQQMQSYPNPEAVTQNPQQSQQHMQHHSGSDMAYKTSNMIPMPAPSSVDLAPSTQQAQDHGMPVPPEKDHNYMSDRSKAFLSLTQAQQDAWNALQAKMGHLTPSGARTPNEPALNAAVLFGGVDSLIEQSQDWWYNDQSQLALGFDNWNIPTTTDWSQLAGSSNLGMPIPSSQSTGQFINAPSMHGGTSQIVNPSLSTSAGYPPVTAQQHLQSMQHGYRHSQGSNASSHTQTVKEETKIGPSVHKRAGSYDQETMY